MTRTGRGFRLGRDAVGERLEDLPLEVRPRVQGGDRGPVTDTALRSGFGSAETLRRAFIRHLGVSPRAYQQRFRSAIRN
jgi:AraC-like DNA-binding protein